MCQYCIYITGLTVVKQLQPIPIKELTNDFKFLKHFWGNMQVEYFCI